MYETGEQSLHYQAILEMSPCGIFHVDVVGSCVYVNPKWTRMTGLGFDDSLGQGWHQVFRREDFEKILDSWQGCALGHTTSEVECRLDNGPDATSSWVICQCVADRDADGEICGYVGSLIDISQRKETEQLLKLETEIASGLANHSSVRAAAGFILDKLLQLDGFDCGGIFLANEEGGINLMAHSGLSRDSVMEIEYHSEDSWQVKMLRELKPFYGTLAELASGRTSNNWSALSQEEFKSVAIIPVAHKGELIASINLASRDRCNISEHIRRVVEGVASEISLFLARMRSEREKENSDSRYEWLFNNLKDAAFLADVELGSIIAANLEAERLLGRPVYDLVGSHQADLHPEDKRQQYADMFRDHILNGGATDVDAEVLTGDGHTIPVSISASILEFNNRPTVLGIFRDISQRKDAEKAVKVSEEKYRALLEAMPDALFLISKDGIFIDYHASDQADGLLHPASNPIGQHLSDLLPEAVCSSIEDRLECVLATGILQVLEYAIDFHNGSHYFEARLTRCDEERAVMILRDVTERKRMETSILQAKDAAEAAVQVKSQFLANMSHEIRTPLNAIIGFTDLVLNTELTEKQIQCLDVVKQRSEDLLVIINDILDLSKIESGKLEMILSEMEIKDMMFDLVRTFMPQWEPKGLQVEWTIDEGTPPVILTDAVRLRQILINLIGNAIKFTDEGSIQVGVGLIDHKDPAFAAFCRSSETGEATEHLHFWVKDTGIGIPEEKRDIIFDAFSQVDGSTARKYGGTGLGLTICNRLVEMFDGAIWVESEVGKGSTFNFTIAI